MTPGSVVIEDALHFAHGVRLGALAADPKFATIHMGSARYFQAQELSLAWNPSARLASMTTEQGGSVLHFQRVWPTAEGKR